jgi:hypothetical protein
MCTYNNLNLLQDDVNVYRSMPSMPDIYHLSHLMPSRPTIDSESMEDDEGTDDDRTFAEVIKGIKTKTAQKSQSSPGGDPMPNHPRDQGLPTGSAGLVLL